MSNVPSRWTSDDSLMCADTFVKIDTSVDKNQNNMNQSGVSKSISLRNEVIDDASEAVQSLLMLQHSSSWKGGQNDIDIQHNERVQRSHSLHDQDHKKTSPFGSEISGSSNSYYQRMRERNNEASKRCRLKRRLRAVGMESQLRQLSSVNSFLKHRVTRMESICQVLKEGIRRIKENDCNCHQTLDYIQKINREHKESVELTNAVLLQTSRAYQDQNPESMFQSSSEDDTMSNDASGPFLKRSLSLPATVKVEIIPETINNTVTKAKLTPTKSENPALVLKRPMTALDAINETILASLGTSTPSPPLPPAPLQQDPTVESNTPLNLVKIVNSCRRPFVPCDIKIEVKTEQELPESTNSIGACLAAGQSDGCSGPFHDVSKLTTLINYVTCLPTVYDDANASFEKAILKSRLGLPFYTSEEETLFLCEHHRRRLLLPVNETVCALCSKAKIKTKAPNSGFFPVTYRISVEYHVKTGVILPIGSYVCSCCSEKHLRGIDIGPRPVTIPEMPNLQAIILEAQRNIEAKNLVTVKPSVVVPVKRAAGSDFSLDEVSFPNKVRLNPINLRGSAKVVAVVTPPQPREDQKPFQSPPLMKVVEDASIFSKINRLNDALRDVNPKYKPIGFSITSIQSCSPSILKDAISATETAVSTLMSIIAPGQEPFLWNSIKPLLDTKLKNLQESVQDNAVRNLH